MSRTSTTPIKFPRTRRNHAVAVLSSTMPGVVHPVAAIPLLREDAMTGRVKINVEMLETKELLANKVNCRVTAHLVPWLAFARFEGSRDQFDRSWSGKPKITGGSVVDFFETHAMGEPGEDPIYQALGLHAAEGTMVNTMYREAYNAIWNFRAANRSRHLTPRLLTDTSLAPAFWQHSRFKYLVPDFDDAMFEGQVALNIVEAKMPVKGIAFGQSLAGFTGPVSLKETGDAEGALKYPFYRGSNTSGAVIVEATSAATDAAPKIFAELAENGITVSLANLELAKKTQAFARLRQQFEGHVVADDWIVDMLMSGLSIPDQALKQPILLADQTVNFGQVKRYSTTAEAMDDSATSGACELTVNLRVPQIDVGGVVMICMEILPEQLFERQADPFFMVTNTRLGDTFKDLPDALRDYLDPQKVDVILNGDIDTAHSDLTGRFGYGPMNVKWTMAGPRVGGKFHRPEVNTTFDEARQRLWAVEAEDPALTEDFYICSQGMHIKPFLDDLNDPFELAAAGNCVISGLTQFGPQLVEATGNYDAVMDRVDTSRIVSGEEEEA